MDMCNNSVTKIKKGALLFLLDSAKNQCVVTLHDATCIPLCERISMSGL